MCVAGLEKHEEFANFVLDLQDRICRTAETADGKGKFIYDKWDRGEGEGYGITRVLEGGNLWEKAACSVSVVRGKLSQDRAKAMSSRGRDAKAGDVYAAAACSLVFHSASPMVPTFRADVRHFQLESGVGWYGGGADLTPYYLFDQDAEDFHRFYKVQYTHTQTHTHTHTYIRKYIYIHTYVYICVCVCVCVYLCVHIQHQGGMRRA